MFKLDLENAEEPEIKSPISVGSSKKQESFRKNICCCFIDYPKAFDSVDHHKLWKILQEMGVPDHLTWLLRNLYAGQEATVRTAMEQQTGSKSGKEYVKAVYCHPAYLTYVQSNPTARHIFWKKRISKRYTHPVFMAALFTLAKTWKQPKCHQQMSG